MQSPAGLDSVVSENPLTSHSSLVTNCLLTSTTYKDPIPWVRCSDMELFAKISAVGASEAVSTACVQEFKAPNSNFIRMCIATMEPGGIFSMIPEFGNSGNSEGSNSSGISERHSSNDMTSQAPSADGSSNTPLNSNNPVSVSEAKFTFTF